MVSVFTPNINLEEPARGDDVGTWDTPVNANTSVIDLVAGGIATISLNNSPIVLSAAQYKCNNITFNSTLTGSVTITFPTSFIKPYTVGHLCTGSSAFIITLTTTAAGGQAICCPPGEFVDVFNDGTNIKFRNLGRVGSYWDYGGSSVPAWVSGCTVAPYLNCDGTTFSSATFPQLAVVLAGNVLPDARGRVRGALNQTTNRMLSSNGGVDGNTNLAGGGGDTQTLTAAQIPEIDSVLATGGINVPVAGGTISNANISNGTGVTFSVPVTNSGVWAPSNNWKSNNTGGQAHPIMQPTYVGGLTLIRSA